MKNFIGKYQQQEQENQVFLGKKLEIQVNLFIQGFNCQEQMTFYYLNALGMWEYNERNFDKVLMQACVKISYLLYNAHQLLLRGEYGVANILLRQVFEYLVIGKYFYKQQNEIWAEKWLEDRKYEVYDKILRLLKIPDKKHLCDFWKVLCSLAHATPSSQQISLDGQFNEIDIEFFGKNNENNHVIYSSYTSESDSTHIEDQLDFNINDNQYHSYKFDYNYDRINYYIDDILKATITTNIPSKKMKVWMGAWCPIWAGENQKGIYHLYIKSFTYKEN